MKTLRVCGWAVIFTVTLLLVACASHTPQVTDTTSKSGPDATMIQPTQKMFPNEDSAIYVSCDWLDERERAIEEREAALNKHEDNAIYVSSDWLDERERAVEDRETVLDQRENALVVNRAWQKELDRLMKARAANLEWRENSLVINQAWLKEREARLTENIHDLTQREEAMALHDAWMDSGTSDYIKLAGADSTRVDFDEGEMGLFEGTEPGAYAYAVIHGRCYANVFVPARYRTVAVTKPIKLPEGEAFKPVLYQTITEQVKVSDEEMRTEEVLCADQITPARITEVQRSLYISGYNPGPIDGILGHRTMAAVNAFQKDHDLTVANELTIETVEHLNVKF